MHEVGFRLYEVSVPQANSEFLVCRSEKKFEKHCIKIHAQTVNHRRHFVDLQGIHTNTIKNLNAGPI